MSLLEDIQKSAIDPNSDLATLLRKCKVLAARLGSQTLEEWVLFESNGYPEEISVPEYRIFELHLKGKFSGPLGLDATMVIPNICIPENIRGTFKNFYCRRSVASLEALIKEGSLSDPVQLSAGDLAPMLGQTVYTHMNCTHAWCEFSKDNIVEVLNVVRNRILDFSLAVWKEFPRAGENDSGEDPKIIKSKITQIFNTTVHNGSANIVGAAIQSTVLINTAAFDFEALKRNLLDNQVQEEEIQELKEALEKDPRPETIQKLGPGVSSWIANMVGKAAGGVWSVALGAAGDLLSQGISRYYGF